jgi:hypothetical protein
MIPSKKDFLRFRSKLKISDKEYFKIAYEFTELKKTFETEDTFELISLIIDLFLQPIYLIYKIATVDFSLLDALSIIKSRDLWIDFLRYLQLYWEIWYWKFMVRLVGGPWISTNDPGYHELVYADGMTRLSCV